MIAFAVSLDGRDICTAGLPGNGVLTAVVDWVSRRADVGTRETGLPPEELELHIGGLDSQSEEHVKWYQGPIAPGNEVLIKVLETAQVDQPTSRRPKSERGDYRCSFCNLSQREVKRLITGPAGAICDRCVAVCVAELNQ